MPNPPFVSIREDSDDRGCLFLPLSSLVRVLGYLSDYREERQITASLVLVESDPDAETVFWLETVLAWKNVYCLPFCLQLTTPGELCTTGADEGARTTFPRQRREAFDPRGDTVGMPLKPAVELPSFHSRSDHASRVQPWSASLVQPVAAVAASDDAIVAAGDVAGPAIGDSGADKGAPTCQTACPDAGAPHARPDLAAAILAALSDGDGEGGVAAAPMPERVGQNGSGGSGGGDGRDALNFASIAARVRRDPRMAGASSEEFVAALDRLLAASDVLEVAPGVYRAIL